MLFVVILSLAALAAAEPEIQQKVQPVHPNVQEHQQQLIQHEQQQMAQDVNTVPVYKQIPQASPLNIYGGYMNSRYFQQMMEHYPFLPYNNNMMSYPYRSNNFLRYMTKPETSVEQPKVNYGTDDIYHVRNINHHHMVNNVHDIKQKHILRKVDSEIVAPYSPVNNNRYTNNFQSYHPKSLAQEYIQPYNTNQYYGKSLALDQEYIQPYNYYNRYWDLDYIRNYYGRDLNTEFTKPYPSSFDFIRNYYGTNLNTEFTKPYPWSLDYIRNYYGRNLNTEFTKPHIQQSSNLNEPEMSVTPYTQSPVVDYFTPKTTKSFGSFGINNYKQPSLLNKPETRRMNVYYTPRTSEFGINSNTLRTSKNLGSFDVDYIQPITPETLNGEFQPEYISRNLESYYPKNFNPYYKNLDLETPLDWNNWSVKGIEDRQRRFKRSEAVQGTTNVATTVQLNHGVPVTQHQLIQGAIQQEGLRQDIQLNAHANAHTNIQAQI